MPAETTTDRDAVSLIDCQIQIQKYKHEDGPVNSYIATHGNRHLVHTVHCCELTCILAREREG